MKALGLAAAILCLAGSAIAETTSPSALDLAVEQAGRAGFAGEVGLTDETATLYAKAVSAPGRAHRLGEVWRWASVTKQLTATLVMQEVSAGRLSLDDTLAQRLPAFGGPSAGKVTMRMLLQHTSGLPNPDDTPAQTGAMPSFYTRATVADDALGFCAGPIKAQPGSGFSYNNCDYIVLGRVLERSSGLSYRDLVAKRIARPLNLASVRVAEAANPATVAGRLDATTPEPDFRLATFGPAGAIYGRPADLLAFDRGLLTHALLDDQATQTAWRGDPKLGYVALGAWSFPAKLKGCPTSVALVERRGEISGVEVRNLLAPAIGRALVVFADRSDLDFGEIWQGKGLSYELASAAFCS